jgi:pyruvate/2-oxoglutarate/acetoin dehydrogenase E1 component
VSERILSYAEALNEAQAEILSGDPEAYLMGLGVPGPTGIFGSTTGLVDKFGPDRVLDMPASEGGMTGIALGSAVCGMRPVLIHMRVDFAVLSMETIVNQAAKWHYMYGGKMTAPMTIRMIIGRGWGQGPQHSQSLQAWFAHVPGLKVVMPSTARDAKGMLIAAHEDPAPVVVLEHRWLYGTTSHVPEGRFTEDLAGARIARAGEDVTLAATSYMTLECLRSAEMLARVGVSAEVIDLRCLTPVDSETVAASVRRTGRLVVADTGHSAFGVVSEVVARVTEVAFADLKAPPVRLGLPMIPTPTTPALADLYYPRAIDIAKRAAALVGVSAEIEEPERTMPWLDVPDPHFTGPY